MEFETFHNDLNAAVMAQAPIELSSHNKPKRLTKSKMNRVRSLLGESLSENSPEALAALTNRSDLPSRYQAALQTFGRTGLMPPVLEGLSARLIAQRHVNRVLRHALAYFICLLGAALLGTLVFLYRIIPTMNMIQGDIEKHGGSDVVGGIDWVGWIPILAIVIAVLLALFSIWTILGGMTKIAMNLGGNHYVRCRTAATSLHVAKLLLEEGASVDEAVSISCELTATDPKGREEVQSAIEELASFQSTDAQSHTKLPNHARDSHYISSISNYLMISAQKRMDYMKMALPMGMVTIFGGIVALVYCFSIFVPIVQLIRELGGAGI